MRVAPEHDEASAGAHGLAVRPIVACAATAVLVVSVLAASEPSARAEQTAPLRRSRSRAGRIHVVRPDGSDRRLVTRDPASGGHGRWLAAGRWVSFYNSAGTWRIRSGGAARQLVSAREAVLSPDGQRFAEFAANGDIVIRWVGGKPIRRIRVPMRRDEWVRLRWSYYPRWPPDGSRLVFPVYRGDSPDAVRITVADVATGATRVLSKEKSPQDYWPLWSPDGRMIAFSRDDDDLWVMRADGGGGRQVARSVDSLLDEPWSPDSTRLLFARGGAIVVASLRTGEVSTVARAKPADDSWTGSAAWSPDGRRVSVHGSRWIESGSPRPAVGRESSYRVRRTSPPGHRGTGFSSTSGRSAPALSRSWHR